jgi:hypothetical protein
VSEIPSARLRAMNVAQAAATQWLFNFVVARSRTLRQAHRVPSTNILLYSGAHNDEEYGL